MRTTRRLRPASLAFVVLIGVAVGSIGAACGSDAAESPSSGPTAGVAGAITVFAAASLTAAFTEIGDAFMVEHPEATVTFNFAASSELVTQIGEGAPADVFASADLSNMAKLTDAANNASEPVVFATNLAQIIVAAGNPLGIADVADLGNDDLIVVLCAPEVPCGRYAAAIFENAGVTVVPKSLEENVRSVVTKVTLGEADAGIVYATDVTAAGGAASGIDIAADVNVVSEYPIAVTKDASNAEGARAFIDFVNGEQSQQILAAYGFLEP